MISPFAQYQRAISNWNREIRDTTADRAFLLGGGHATVETIEEVLADARANRAAILQEMGATGW